MGPKYDNLQSHSLKSSKAALITVVPIYGMADASISHYYSSQNHKFVENLNGTFFLVNAATHQIVDARLSDGEHTLIMSANEKERTQKWSFDNNNGIHKLRSKAFGLSLDAPISPPSRDIDTLALIFSHSGIELEITMPETDLFKISVPSRYGMVMGISDTNVLQLCRDTGKKSQRWIISRVPPPIEPGIYYIFNLLTGTTLDLFLTPSVKEDYTPVKCYNLHGGPNQQWMIELGEAGYRIKSCVSGTYVGYHTGLRVADLMSVTGNANPVEFDIHGDAEKGYAFFVIDKQSSMVLDLCGGSSAEGTDVLFCHWSDSSNQKWTIVPPPELQRLRPRYVGPLEIGGTIRIRNAKTGTSIDWSGGDNGYFHGWTSYHGHNQQWALEPGIYGYKIKHPSSGLYVTEQPGRLYVGPVGREFLFDGNPEDGYFILDAQNPIREVEFEGGSAANWTKIIFARGRRQKWLLQGY